MGEQSNGITSNWGIYSTVHYGSTLSIYMSDSLTDSILVNYDLDPLLVQLTDVLVEVVIVELLGAGIASGQFEYFTMRCVSRCNCRQLMKGGI